MSVATTDLVVYGSANMPENDTGAAGGAIAGTKRIVFDDATLANTLNDKVDIVSDNAGDTTQSVTITGRNASGSIITELLNLNGTTAVLGGTTFERILKIVVSAAHTGTITVSKNTGSTTIVGIETGVTEIRRPFYDVSADVAGGSQRDFYEKVFVKNNNGINALLTAQLLEQADPEAQIEFAMEDVIDGIAQLANRITAPGAGVMTADGLSSTAKNVPGNQISPGAAIGVWLYLTLPAGDPATKTTYTLRTTGTST